MPGTAAQLPGVLALRRSLMGDDIYWDDEAYLQWRYRFGASDRGGGDCWVLLLANTVRGMVGTEEVLLQIGERRIPSWSTMDIAIDPALEGSGLGSWMNLRICEIAGCALTIGSNEKSRNMISRCFRRVGEDRVE